MVPVEYIRLFQIEEFKQEISGPEGVLTKLGKSISVPFSSPCPPTLLLPFYYHKSHQIWSQVRLVNLTRRVIEYLRFNRRVCRKERGSNQEILWHPYVLPPDTEDNGCHQKTVGTRVPLHEKLDHSEWNDCKYSLQVSTPTRTRREVDESFQTPVKDRLSRSVVEGTYDCWEDFSGSWERTGTGPSGERDRTGMWNGVDLTGRDRSSRRSG